MVKGHWTNDFQGSSVMAQESMVKVSVVTVRSQGHCQRSRVTGQRSWVRVNGQRSKVKSQWSMVMITVSSAHWSEVKGKWSRVTGQRSLDMGHWLVKGHCGQWLKVTGQWSRVWSSEFQGSCVKGHDQRSLSEVRVTGQRLKVTGQRSIVRVKGHLSRVMCQRQWSRVMIRGSVLGGQVTGQRSRVTGQWSSLTG